MHQETVEHFTNTNMPTLMMRYVQDCLSNTSLRSIPFGPALRSLTYTTNINLIVSTTIRTPLVNNMRKGCSLCSCLHACAFVHMHFFLLYSSSSCMAEMTSALRFIDGPSQRNPPPSSNIFFLTSQSTHEENALLLQHIQTVKNSLSSVLQKIGQISVETRLYKIYCP